MRCGMKQEVQQEVRELQAETEDGLDVPDARHSERRWLPCRGEKFFPVVLHLSQTEKRCLNTYVTFKELESPDNVEYLITVI